MNFQKFLYQFSIHEMALFGDILGPNSPKYCQILLKFSPQVVFKEQKYCFKNLWKTQIFTEMGDTQSLHFWSNFDPFFPPEDGQNKKKMNFGVKSSAIGLSKNCEIKTYLFSTSSEK